jgi:hypothetical protein
MQPIPQKQKIYINGEKKGEKGRILSRVLYLASISSREQKKTQSAITVLIDAARRYTDTETLASREGEQLSYSGMVFYDFKDKD